ncbi:MAG: nuclear transport factor 2 family protein [Kofleriaceae bacterium]
MACGSSKQEVNAARHSLYDTDFAVVYSAALAATRELYPQLDDSPGPGRIGTSWHQVQYANCAGAGSTCDDSMGNQQVINQQQGVSANQASGNTGAAAAAGMPTRLAYKRYFIRFDVHVLGGRPWRVKVTGHASEWDPGAAMPVEMKGADKPHWLEGRTEALQVAIYKKIKQYAIPMKEIAPGESPEEQVAGPKTDPNTFKNVPPGAAKELAGIKDAIGKRDYSSLRPHLADDVVWSLGGGTGADAAMAMWQADPSTLDALAATLATCGSDGAKVSCPVGAPVPNAWQLTLEQRGPDWRITSFVKSE